MLFQYGQALTQHYKKIKNNWQRVNDNQNEINYPTQRNDFNKVERNVSHIALVMLYLDIDVKVFKYNDREYGNIHKSIKQIL